MAKFAVVNGEIVENIILAETKEIAEEVTGLTCVEAGDTLVLVGTTKYIDGEFVNPKEVEPEEVEPEEIVDTI
jgi:hypothetical protein